MILPRTKTHQVGVLNACDFPLTLEASCVADVPPEQIWDTFVCPTHSVPFTLGVNETTSFKFRYTVPQDVQEGDIATFYVRCDPIDPPEELDDTYVTYICAYDTIPPVIHAHQVTCHSYVNETGEFLFLSPTLDVSDETVGVDYSIFNYSVDDGPWIAKPIVAGGVLEQNMEFLNRVYGICSDADKINYRFTVADKLQNNVTSDIYTLYVPKCEITNIAGGLGVSADIQNTGLAELTNLNWSIHLSGKLFMGGYTQGAIDIPTEEAATIHSDPFFGFGPTTITVTAGDETKTASGFMLGPLVLGPT